MYPARLQIETKSHAERSLYDLFRDNLPNDYIVFHSVAWQARDLRSGAVDGEADFIIAHPERGLLVLEVKGGRIRYDGPAGQWFSNETPIKDPFEQARGNKYSLLQKLKDLPYWSDRWLTIGHAVAFPDVVAGRDLRLDAPAAIVLDAENLRDLRAWVEAALAHYRQEDSREGALGHRGIEELIALLSPSWELRAPLAAQFLDEGRQIIRLTEEQFYLLDFLSSHRRVAISGCAGSGKTTMALEQARRLGRQGFRVLVTCFNTNLAEFLRSDETLPETVEVVHFHGLCRQMAERAGLTERANRKQGTQEWYDNVLPEVLAESADILGPQYDAVIVDEGQDFQSHWGVPLQCLLGDAERGIFYVFYDDNQNLYQTACDLCEGLARFSLTRNCRNTRHIHRTFLPFYRSSVVPQALGPEGRPPEMRYYTDVAGLQRNLRQVLHRLTVEEDVPGEDIVILTPRAWENSTLSRLGPLANLRLTNRWPPGPAEVYCTSVYKFKGLESPVVILAELHPSGHQDLEKLLYVGCSRARHHLIILAEETIPESIRARLPGGSPPREPL